jgi:DNA-binding protein HU-beta
MSSERISEKLAEKHGLPPAVLRQILMDALLEIERQALESGRCQIRGFGVFRVRTSAARPARNVATGQAVTAPAQTKLVFHHGRDRRQRLRQDGQDPARD